MTRSAKLLLAFAMAAMAIPVGLRAQAQEPKDSKVTKEAQKLITLARVKQASADQLPLYQQALGGLQEAMQKDSANPKVWLLAGEAYAGAGQYPAADAALKKAESMHPAYAAEIAATREQAWMTQFQKGAAALDRSQPDSALTLLLSAETMYSERPEAVLNIGVIYLNSQKYREATEALNQAKARLQGPLAAKLKPEDQAQWKTWEKLIETLQSQIASNEGITAFQAEKFPEAADAFVRASKINPYSRDHVYNLAQSYFAMTARIEKARSEAEGKKPPAAAAAEVKKLDEQLAPLYEKQIEASNKLLTFEPYSSDAYIMLAKAYRGLSLGSTVPAEKKADETKAMDALNVATKLPFELSGLSVSFADSTATMTGKIKNHMLKAGEHAKLKVTFLTLDGSVAGVGDVDVPVAGGADTETPFEIKPVTKGAVAGWKYEAIK